VHLTQPPSAVNFYALLNRLDDQRLQLADMTQHEHRFIGFGEGDVETPAPVALGSPVISVT
jgi:hypothetical protein